MDINVNDKLSSLQEISKCQLSKILNASAKIKDLVLEPRIIRPLERVCGIKWLRGNGVEKVFKLEETTPNFNAPVVFYMIYSDINTFKQVVDQIRSTLDLTNPIENKYNIIVVPKSLYIYEEILEQEGLLHTVIKLHSFQWQPIHLDTGILSLELPQIYNTLYVNQDYSLLPAFAKCLWHLFFVCGKPKFIMSLGQLSNAVLNQLDVLCNDVAETDRPYSDFGGVIIIDRSVDYVSALLTPCTYSALLSEVYDVRTGICEHKTEEVDDYDNKCNPIIKKQAINFTMSSKQDSIYSDIKNRHFTEVTSVLVSLTKKLQNEGQHLKEMVLDQIKQYIETQLQAAKSKKKLIATHLTVAETIINTLGARFEIQQDVEQNILLNKNRSSNVAYLEEMLTTENDRYISLRLFCLLCVTQKLSESEIRSFWTKYLHEYGFKYGYVQSNLINTNFLNEEISSITNLPNIISKLPKFTQNNFYTVAAKLRQIPNDPKKIDVKSPTCCSYVFAGCYIPLITQLTNTLLHKTPLDEVRSKLEALGPLTIRNDKGYPLERRSVLLCIVGGVTYAEIAACNLLESLTGAKITVLSDRVISGNDIMKSMFQLFGNTI